MTGDYLPGPNPDLRPPSVAEAARAQESLQRAQRFNRAAGRVVAGITPQEAHILVRWMVYNARDGVARSGNGDLRTLIDLGAAAQARFDPASVRGACGWGSSLVGMQAEMMGIEHRYHQAARLSNHSTVSHAFSVLSLPIQVDGRVTSSPFLVDTTLRQFFNKPFEQLAAGIDDMLPGEEAGRAVRHVPTWGHQLSQTEAGRHVANQILVRGYVPLTPETAQLYLGSQMFIASAESPDKALRVSIQPDEAYGRLIGSGSGASDATVDELLRSRTDIRTPIMVREGAAASDVVRLHNASPSRSVPPDLEPSYLAPEPKDPVHYSSHDGWQTREAARLAGPHLPHRPLVEGIKKGAKMLVPPLIGGVIATVLMGPTRVKAEQAFRDGRLTEQQLKEWYVLAGSAIVGETPGFLLSGATGIGSRNDYAAWANRHGFPRDLVEALNPTSFHVAANSEKFMTAFREGLASAQHVPSVQTLQQATENWMKMAAQVESLRFDADPGFITSWQRAAGETIEERLRSPALVQSALALIKAEMQLAELGKALTRSMADVLADPVARSALKPQLLEAAMVGLPSEVNESYPPSLNAAIVARNELRDARFEAVPVVMSSRERYSGTVPTAAELKAREVAAQERLARAEQQFWATVEVSASDGSLHKFSSEQLVVGEPKPATGEVRAMGEDAARHAARAAGAGADGVRLAEARPPEDNDLPPDLRGARDTQGVSGKAT